MTNDACTEWPVVAEAVPLDLGAIARVARGLERLVPGGELVSEGDRQTRDLVVEGLELLGLLIRDNERRLAGHPPALLGEAADVLVERVSHARPGSPARGLCLVGPWANRERLDRAASPIQALSLPADSRA